MRRTPKTTEASPPRPPPLPLDLLAQPDRGHDLQDARGDRPRSRCRRGGRARSPRGRTGSASRPRPPPGLRAAGPTSGPAPCVPRWPSRPPGGRRPSSRRQRADQRGERDTRLEPGEDAERDGDEAAQQEHPPVARENRGQLVPVEVHMNISLRGPAARRRPSVGSVVRFCERASPAPADPQHPTRESTCSPQLSDLPAHG